MSLRPACFSLAFSLGILSLSLAAWGQIRVAESVLTQHNDPARTGAYLAEKELTPTSVKSSFGRLYSLAVEGQIAAQPLYAEGVLIKGVSKSVLYVATRMNNVYAFDVGSSELDPARRLLWQREFPSAPTAARGTSITAVWRDPNNPDHLDLFMTDEEGTVRSAYWELLGGWRSWFAIGGRRTAAPGQPITAVWRDPNHLDLFMTDKDGFVRSTNWELPRGWRSWFAIRPGTGPGAGRAAPGQPITALWRPPDHTHLDLFMTDEHGTVKSIYCDLPSTCWQSESWFAIRPDSGRAGRIQAITAVWGDPNNPDHLNLFMTDKDGIVKEYLLRSPQPVLGTRPMVLDQSLLGHGCPRGAHHRAVATARSLSP